MWFFRRKKKEVVRPIVTETKHSELTIEDFLLKREVNQSEKELISIITSCIAASSQVSSKFKIKSIHEIDLDKEMAAVIVGAICANDKPQSQFKLVRIEEYK